MTLSGAHLFGKLCVSRSTIIFYACFRNRLTNWQEYCLYADLQHSHELYTYIRVVVREVAILMIRGRLRCFWSCPMLRGDEGESRKCEGKIVRPVSFEPLNFRNRSEAKCPFLLFNFNKTY